MSSISDLCWTDCADLFRKVELRRMYSHQKQVLGGGGNSGYPFLILVYTGKITIAINLGAGLRDQRGDFSSDSAEIAFSDDVGLISSS